MGCMNQERGETNENGEHVEDLGAPNQLVNGVSIFPHKRIPIKVTWRSSDRVIENQIGHICIIRKFRRPGGMYG